MSLPKVSKAVLDTSALVDLLDGVERQAFFGYPKSDRPNVVENHVLRRFKETNHVCIGTSEIPD